MVDPWYDHGKLCRDHPVTVVNHRFLNGTLVQTWLNLWLTIVNHGLTMVINYGQP